MFIKEADCTDIIFLHKPVYGDFKNLTKLYKVLNIRKRLSSLPHLPHPIRHSTNGIRQIAPLPAKSMLSSAEQPH